MKGEKMEETKRPGVLTALAVINFILAFLYIVLNGLAVLTFLFIDNVPLGNLGEAQIAVFYSLGHSLITSEFYCCFCYPRVRFLLFWVYPTS